MDGPQKAVTSLRNLIYQYRISHVVHVAARLGLADVVQDGAQTTEEVARAVGAHVRTLRVLLQALTSVGVLTETEGRFALTPMGALLRSDTPGSLRWQATMQATWVWRTWGDLEFSVRTGKPAFDRTGGMTHWEYLARDPEAGQIFDKSIAAQTAREAEVLVAAYDFGDKHVIVDLGGGRGVLIAAILRAHPQLRGILLDRADVVAGARAQLAQEGVADRCTCLAGNFFDSVPANGDVYILKWVLCDHNDEKVAALLSTCRRTMPEGSKLLVIDTLLTGGTEEFSLHLLLLNGGGLRTEAEYGALLAAAGFEVKRVLQVTSRSTVFDTVRA